jgi:hypothetical protein
MSDQPSATQLMDRSAEAVHAQPPGPQRGLKLALLLVSVTFSLAAFLALDYFRSQVILRRVKAADKQGSCRVADPVRHHALKPNCAFVERWGRDTYDYFTNSLGFRDAKVRDVPLVEASPRILILGNSYTEGESSWPDSYVGKIAAALPQYDFLNGAGASYSPSNHLNIVRKLLADGVHFDEVIIFSGAFDVFNEAAFYRDLDASGAVAGPEHKRWNISRYSKARFFVARNFMLTNRLVDAVERFLVGHGLYHLATDQWRWWPGPIARSTRPTRIPAAMRRWA